MPTRNFTETKSDYTEYTVGKSTVAGIASKSGVQLEDLVGAYYLLSMLLGSEPRGLPGTIIDSIKLQSEGEGYHLDDVIIKTHDSQGAPATLEIQVKRSLDFTPSDLEFKKVVKQIAKAYKKHDFLKNKYELAIAIARSSKQIEGAYQDVLTWAKEMSDPREFIQRCTENNGSANNKTRQFIEAFKIFLIDAGLSVTNHDLWLILSRLHILVFDFTAKDSQSEALAKERAATALHTDDKINALKLWDTLIAISQKVAAAGGDRNREKLTNELHEKNYRLAGEMKYLTARSAISELTKHALTDIKDEVGGISLARSNYVSQVHNALIQHNYVELRGDAGVGKSGILKHFVNQISCQSCTILLIPGRVPPGGWVAVKNTINFDGTARELLVDIASSGGATIFVDNLDFYSKGERKTVIDLISEASKIPGFSVIVSARRSFAYDEPNWLPAEAIECLGRSEPIFISELSELEVDEIRKASPKIALLLAENHPAKAVVRNLFRLSQLIDQPDSNSQCRTEVDMAIYWYKTAGYVNPDNRRGCLRLLKSLGEHLLTSNETFDTSNFEPDVIDILIKNNTLIETSDDQVKFKHDVFGEWAIFNLLKSNQNMAGNMLSDKPPRGPQERALELYVRLIIEEIDNEKKWSEFIIQTEDTEIHDRWHRAALLAIFRSEISGNLFVKASDALLANHAKILRELIRYVIAIEVIPMKEHLKDFDIKSSIIPNGLYVPVGISWLSLILWLLSLKDKLPGEAIPDVFDLFITWTNGSFGHDPLTPLIVSQIYSWMKPHKESKRPFGGTLDIEQVRKLNKDLRVAFITFCHKKPDLAAQYLNSLSRSMNYTGDIEDVFKFCDSLAKAAPKELSEFTNDILIQPLRSSRHSRDERNNPFMYHNHFFSPASPMQGPFFALLTHDRDTGLSLIRKLVDHAIVFNTNGNEYGTNKITISFPDGDRDFPWTQSYGWSRDRRGDQNCVTSALMALEAWAHTNIEKGVPVEEILEHIIGGQGSPAAYLLIAVDILVSHWPITKEVAIPYLACPKLLCIDHLRPTLDNIKSPDFFGLDSIKKEPLGVINSEYLNKRPSRWYSIESLLGNYRLSDSAELREGLLLLLQDSAKRLGTPDESADFSDPAFMVAHALNCIEPKNWSERQVPLENGEYSIEPMYVAPQSEHNHLERLRKESDEKMTSSEMQLTISSLLENSSQSSPEFARGAIEWAKKAKDAPENETADEKWMREQAIISAAMIAMRDGDNELRELNKNWAQEVFCKAFNSKEDPSHRSRSGLRFNPIAIAFSGAAHLVKYNTSSKKIRTLLEVAATGNPASAHGFYLEALALSFIDSRLPKSILRCALTSCIHPYKEWDTPEKDVSLGIEMYRKRVNLAVESELAWLSDNGGEPNWPKFPNEKPQRKPGIQIGNSKTNGRNSKAKLKPPYSVDHQAAALWLNSSRMMFNILKFPWLKEIVLAYSEWTSALNGCKSDSRMADDWNDAYFRLYTNCLPVLEKQEILQFVKLSICSLSDESFFDAITLFIRHLDGVYFNDQQLEQSVALNIRLLFANRIMSCNGWRQLSGSRSSSIETHIGPAIAVLLFNDYVFASPPKCYLNPKGIEMIDVFLPIMQNLVESASCIFVATLTLNILEVSPHPRHLPFLIAVANAWHKIYPNNVNFWVEYGIGHRVCNWIEMVMGKDPISFEENREIKHGIEQLLSSLISLGIADAERIERRLCR